MKCKKFLLSDGESVIVELGNGKFAWVNFELEQIMIADNVFRFTKWGYFDKEVTEEDKKEAIRILENSKNSSRTRGGDSQPKEKPEI